ncbi:hypothetical protein QR680_017383 [Steinernema hermaphroditum]|uniref:DH domain-containing protein n=1 Tax=Steinernema hermaphroditum TaxID=289476 RepID=A0AA39HEC2_9BILA|nr:hypothetical protein QR680_017383 [Steinernema hermaphroditum]
MVPPGRADDDHFASDHFESTRRIFTQTLTRREVTVAPLKDPYSRGPGSMLDTFDHDPRAESVFSSLFSPTFSEARFDPVRIAAASHLNLPAFLEHPVAPALESRRSVRSFRQKRSRSQPLHVEDASSRVSSLLVASDDSIELYSTSSSKDTSDSGVTVSDDNNCVLMARAVGAHVALLADDLPFSTGDLVNILDSTTHAGLWFGICAGRTGWFPANLVKIVDPSAPSEWPLDVGFSEESRCLRRRVLHELLATERDYVALLHNVAFGYVEQSRRNDDLFSASLVASIFSNIEKLLVLHSTRLLSELEEAVDRRHPENSAVADVFLRNSEHFEIYADYCNNRMISCAILAKLLEDPRYVQFFEACRLLRSLPKLNLESFLLSPVQRLCRYPIQLRELLKATPMRHPDRRGLEQALLAMKGIANRVDRRMTRLEAVQRVISWQQAVVGFRGPNLIENNCRLLHSGEVVGKCFARSALQWAKTVHLFLFDQSMVICKKIVKKNESVFKERFSMNAARLGDIPEGKESANAFRIETQTRLYVFCCKDAESKGAWLEKLHSRPPVNPPSVHEIHLAHLSLKYR